MGIGPFTTYAPPGVYTRTITEPIVGQLLGGLRVPVLIGTGKETLSQTDFELVRGSSSVADTPIFAEDATGRFVIGGSQTNPTLGNADGVHGQFRVRNYPIVDGDGIGRLTYDVSKVSVKVNGQQVVVSAVDGPNGLVALLVPPQLEDIVLVDYFFHRKDTRVTDDVSSQVTGVSAVLVAPKAEPYNITLGVSDTLSVTVNDAVVGVVTLASGSRLAADVANDINAAAITGLTSSVHIDAQGLSHVQLIAQGNILIGSGNSNGALGFNPGDYTNRNKSFVVFNGPIVDGSDGGVTTTDPSSVSVTVNGTPVIAKSVDGKNQTVTLAAAPTPGTVVAVTYYFNTFQDTFDYLPNSSIVSVGNVGIAPGRRDYLNGPDFVVVNDGDQSKIQWGTAWQVISGEKTGTNTFDSTQITGLLVDDRIFGVPCTRFTDSATAQVSETKFTMPLTPTTGNGRDTPLGQSLYQTITNGRIDLPTSRPDLVIVYVGKNFRDAYARPPVVVLSVDSSTNTIVLRDPVPADYEVFATFWYNRIGDDTFTFNVVTGGPSGTGQYTVFSQKTAQYQLGVKFGTKTGLSQTIQWPSGSEILPDAFHTGDGISVSETATVEFDSALLPAQNASFSNSGQSPYDIYTYTRIFGGVVVDGNPAVSVDLSLPYRALVLGQPVLEPLSFATTDYLLLQVDGTIFAPVSLTGLTTVAGVATAINAVIDADVQVHADGSGTFASTSPNNLVSALTYGSNSILKVKGRNLPSSTNGLTSSILVLVPTGAGQTDGSRKTGLAPNLTSSGSYSGINQPAFLVGSMAEPFNVQSGVTDSVQLTIDGADFSTIIPSGTTVSLDDVVTAINDAYMSVASTTDIAAYTSALVSLVNDIKAQYTVHIASITVHTAADGVNTIVSPNATNLATAVTLVNELKTKYDAHLSQVTVHQLNDTTNVETLPAAIDLQTAVTLAHDLKEKYNTHLMQIGVHGFDDTVNVESLSTITLSVLTAADDGFGLVEITTTTPHGMSNGDKVFISGVVGTTEANGGWLILSTGASTFTLTGSVFTNAYISGGSVQSVTSEESLVNDIKTQVNAHYLQAGVHQTNDVVNTIVAANASDTAAGPWTTASTLVNQIKANLNLHIASATYHNVADTTNAVVTVDSTAGSLTSIFTLAAAIKVAYNTHRLQLQGAYHVHGTDDLVNVATAVLPQLVAQVGQGAQAGKLVLVSRTNSPISGVVFKSLSTAGGPLGFVPGSSSSRTQPSASSIAAAINGSASFSALAVSYPVLSAGLGTFLEINSRTAGSTSTISFTNVTNTAFIPDTGIGIVPGSSSAIGENAQSGFSVSSSAGLSGSHGTGIPGQTYTDQTTGLRFTVLPASGGDYTSGGKFTLVVNQTFTVDASIPVKEIPGIEVSVYNTVGMNPGTTALLSTFERAGTHPKVGDVYYISYQFAKTDTSTALFRDLKTIQQNFGTPTPDNPLSLGARLALLNGAVLIGLKQVLRAPGSSQASLGSFTAAIDEQQKPMTGNVKPDVITPLATDPQVFAYLNQHCIFMSSPRQEGERIAVVGPAVGTTALGAQSIAKGLNSEMAILTYPDSYIITVTDNLGNSSQQLVDASYMAAAIAGSTCNPSIDVATPLTRRQIIGFSQMGRILDPTEANQIAVSGVSIIEQSDQGLRIRHGLTTNPSTVITRTPSVTMTIQYVQQTMRRVLDPYIGQKFTGALLKSAENAITGAFQTMIDQQIVTKVAGISVSVDPNDPTIMRTEAIYVPVFPLEYIVSTLQIRIRL